MNKELIDMNEIILSVLNRYYGNGNISNKNEELTDIYSKLQYLCNAYSIKITPFKTAKNK